ncbi:MAG: amino acid ABC transporter ATP-binding protein [Myxococcales bacterium]|nr:amino acid ABC transporter ATP-binding protein [Myxococcales bacterium]
MRAEKVVRTRPGAREPVLRELTFELESGALVALLGPSGAGKTTLLRCLIGLEPFESGEIAVDEVVVRGSEQSGQRERERAIGEVRRRVGLVFQSYELFPHLSVLENCLLAPVRVRSEPRRKAEERARELLERLGLEEKLGAFPEQLSGGQRQRVAIARALVMEPRVLLYDEPTSSLDPSLKEEVWQTLKRVEATGVTQVVVTHELGLARRAEQVCVMDQGRVIESGPPERVLVAPEREGTRRLLASWPAAEGAGGRA